MGEEFKDFTTTPTLTFGETPDTQELPSTVAEETEFVADSAFNENNLTAEEKKMVEDFSSAVRLFSLNAESASRRKEDGRGLFTEDRSAQFTGYLTVWRRNPEEDG